MSDELGPHQLDVVYVFTTEATDETSAQLSSQLTLEEIAEHNRLLRPQDRLSYSVGRSLVRKLLSHYAPTPQNGWRFERTPHGKPFVVPNSEAPDIRFNISHANGIVAAAFSLEREIGVDVECLDLEVSFLEIARSHFSSTEIDLLEALPPAQQKKAFYSSWTLKEAYLKAHGHGLSVPLSDFTFSLTPPTISFLSPSSESPNQWYFSQHELSTSHLLALAARRDPGAVVTCKITQVALQSLIKQDVS